MLIVPDILISIIGLALLMGIWYIQKQRKDDSGEMKARISI